MPHMLPRQVSSVQERIEALNDRANTIFGFVLLGKADLADIAEMERSANALQDALCEDQVPEASAACPICDGEAYTRGWLRDGTWGLLPCPHCIGSIPFPAEETIIDHEDEPLAADEQIELDDEAIEEWYGYMERSDPFLSAED